MRSKRLGELESEMTSLDRETMWSSANLKRSSANSTHEIAFSVPCKQSPGESEPNCTITSRVRFQVLPRSAMAMTCAILLSMGRVVVLQRDAAVFVHSFRASSRPPSIYLPQSHLRTKRGERVVSFNVCLSGLFAPSNEVNQHWNRSADDFWLECLTVQICELNCTVVTSRKQQHVIDGFSVVAQKFGHELTIFSDESDFENRFSSSNKCLNDHQTNVVQDHSIFLNSVVYHQLLLIKLCFHIIGHFVRNDWLDTIMTCNIDEKTLNSN
jgi:hypothetical protein